MSVHQVCTTTSLLEEQCREDLQTSVHVVSPPEALDQSPISFKFGCNIVLIQLGLKLSVVNKYPAEMANGW